MIKRIIVSFISSLFLLTTFVLAAGEAQRKKDPDPAPRPSKCESTLMDVDTKQGGQPKKQHKTPPNCIFLEEPIGGRPGYDLFTVNCYLESRKSNPEGCVYSLWNGEAIAPPTYGPVQAILAWDPEKKEEQGFTLFYNYLSLIYNYFSGLIVGLVVLFIIIGGIQMSTSAGDTAKFDAGKNRIIKAILGMIIWFIASLILYTINPTFFAF